LALIYLLKDFIRANPEFASKFRDNFKKVPRAAKANVAVPIRRSVVQVEGKRARFRAIVPVAATDSCRARTAASDLIPSALYLVSPVKFALRLFNRVNKAHNSTENYSL